MGTPAALTDARAAVFDPVRLITAPGGPTNVSPACAHASANAGFSERNPYPGCTASAFDRLAASITRGMLR